MPRTTLFGFSLVEMLIAMGIMVIVLGMASVFFAQQTKLQRAVQARNDVQDRMRVATQLVTQDLSLAGAAIRIAPDGTIDTAAGAADCAQAGPVRCVDVRSDLSEPDTASTLRIRYVSSQFPSGEACRDVSYRLDGDVLQRSDVVCPVGLEPELGTDAYVDLAPDMLGFKVVVVCSTGDRVDTFTTGSCGSGYGRSAIVSVGGRSSIPTDGASPEVGFVSTQVDPLTDSFARMTVACPAGRVCFGMTQEVLMPNLKDQ